MFRFNNRYGEYEGNSIGHRQSLNNLRGVDLSISYRNKYDDLIQRQKTEKEKYAQFLKEQEQYMNIKRQKMLEEKRRQDMLDELRLQRERKLIELRQLREKDKIKDILIKSDYHNKNLIQNELIKSQMELMRSKSEAAQKEVKNKLKKDNGKNFIFFEDDKSFDDNVKVNAERIKVVDNRIYNKKMLEEIERLKFNNLCQSEDLKKSIKTAFDQVELAKNYKNIMLRQVQDLRKELHLNNINQRFIHNFYKSEYLDKIVERRKKMLEEEKKQLELPYLDLDKEGFLIGQNVNNSNGDIQNDNKEIDEISRRVDLCRILQKNQRRLEDITKYEKRGII